MEAIDRMEVKIDDLYGVEIAKFLEEHITEMKSVTPPESKHALDLEGLRKPEITFWTVWDEICMQNTALTNVCLFLRTRKTRTVCL
jgi:hypothetical protein